MLTRRAIPLLPALILGLVLLHCTSAFAQTQEATDIQTSPPAATEPAPADDAPAGQAPAELVPARPRQDIRPEELMSPGLLSELTRQWSPFGNNPVAVTDGGNVTVLSIPTAYSVYIVPTDVVAAAMNAGMNAPSLQTVVFDSHYLVGETPLTVHVPAGDHVLVVRAMSRHNGFDGGCIMKATYDLITGGHRYAYHLYPLRKRDGQYQCFVANFVWRDCPADDIGTGVLRRGAFRFPEEELRSLISARTQAPRSEIERLAHDLNVLGVAFYDFEDHDYLVKVIMVGNMPEVMEWRVDM